MRFRTRVQLPPPPPLLLFGISDLRRRFPPSPRVKAGPSPSSNRIAAPSAADVKSFPIGSRHGDHKRKSPLCETRVERRTSATCINKSTAKVDPSAQTEGAPAGSIVWLLRWLQPGFPYPPTTATVLH